MVIFYLDNSSICKFINFDEKNSKQIDNCPHLTYFLVCAMNNQYHAQHCVSCS